jgi:hypothetical protein
MNGLSLEEIKNEIQQLDPILTQDDPVFQTAVVLLAAAFATGPDTGRLVTFTGYPERFVATISERMRQFGFWTDSGGPHRPLVQRRQMDPWPVGRLSCCSRAPRGSAESGIIGVSVLQQQSATTGKRLVENGPEE